MTTEVNAEASNEPQTQEPVKEEQNVDTPDVPKTEDTPGDASDSDVESTEKETPAEDVEESEGVDEQEQFPEYDLPELNQVTNLLQEAGVSLEDATAIFGAAVESNNLDDIDTEALKERLGNKSDVVMLLVQTAYEKQVKQTEELTNVAYDAVGGKEVYDLVKTWANEKEQKDPEFAKELNEIRDLVNTQNKRVIKAAVKDLFAMFKDDPNTTIPAELLKGDGKPGSTVNEPMTKVQYGAAVEAARRKGTYDQERAQLWARRQAGMKQGI